jgi:hypothetical protein
MAVKVFPEPAGFDVGVHTWKRGFHKKVLNSLVTVVSIPVYRLHALRENKCRLSVARDDIPLQSERRLSLESPTNLPTGGFFARDIAASWRSAQSQSSARILAVQPLDASRFDCGLDAIFRDVTEQENKRGLNGIS